LTAQANSKNPMPRGLFITIFEIGVLGGCVVAAFLAPPTFPLQTFLIICAGAFVVANALLLIRLRKPADSSRKVNNTRLNLAAGLGLLLLIWQIYERYGR
jgi:heme A synthase